MKIVWLIIIKQKRDFWLLMRNIGISFSLRAHQFWWSWKQWKAARGTYVALTRDQEGAAFLLFSTWPKLMSSERKNLQLMVAYNGIYKKSWMSSFSCIKQKIHILNPIFEVFHNYIIQMEVKSTTISSPFKCITKKLFLQIWIFQKIVSGMF